MYREYLKPDRKSPRHGDTPVASALLFFCVSWIFAVVCHFWGELVKEERKRGDDE